MTSRFDRRAPRLGTLALVVALVAPLITSLVEYTPAAATGNTLSFENGDTQLAVGPNAAIYIDGTVVYDAKCDLNYEPVIEDFVYSASDVYIVPHGTVGNGSKLEDAGGAGPNTIVATSTGVFVGEMIGVTTPSGKLGAGTYDVVYDTCQNGTFEAANDSIFENAITVDIPDGELPPVSSSILQLKEQARQQYVYWLQTQIMLKVLFNIEEAQALVECILSVSWECVAEIAAGLAGIESQWDKTVGELKQHVLDMAMNRAKNYGAIWQDPPDTDFRQLTAITAEPVTQFPATGSPTKDALAALGAPLSEEGALTTALLHAIERYQGAQAAGDEDWALIQARSVRDLSATLAEQLASTTAVQDVRDAFAADIDGIVSRATAASAIHTRIRTSGFDLDERRAFANRGMSAAEVNALEASITDDGQLVVPSGDQLLANFDGLLAARSGMVTALQASISGWGDVATAIQGRVTNPIPVANAGGPYAASDGSVHLDASASTTPAGSTIVSYEWDLDGDGQYDDATGPTPTVAVDGGRVVALRVTNDAGFATTDAAVIAAAAPVAPTIGSMSPAPAVTATVGQTTAFQVGASGSGLSYAWRFGDGPVVGTDTTFAYTPTVADVGTRSLTVTVTSGGVAAVRTWWVSTLDIDADGDGWTATSDCDDSRADVHPAGFERLGNDRDDDCDPRTPDTPVGGLTGQVWSWGSFMGLGTGSGADSNVPVHVTTLPDEVRGVESSFRGGYALLTDGTVRAWGLNYSGRLGDGSHTNSLVPVTVQNVGGGGALGNVVALSSDSEHVLALLADGSVRAWGANSAHQLGDNTAVTDRPTPVVVLDENWSPLSGVAEVDTSTSTSYAVMQDGTVKVFGQDFCNGTYNPVVRPLATTNTNFGDHVVQLESGLNGATITLEADGSVRTCAAATQLLGRPVSTIPQATTPGVVTGFGPGSGAIDVAMGFESGLILTEDGRVYTWGYNANHSLDVVGVAGGATQWTPVEVPLPPGPPVVDVETDAAATMYATRADGSVVVWGANIYSGGGAGTNDYAIVGTPTIDLGDGQAISVTNANWDGLALVHPVTPGEAPLRPIQWIDVTVDDASIGEATGGDVTIHLSDAAPTDVTVDFTFNRASGSAVVPAGATSVVVPVSVADDTVDEDDEHLPFTITAVADGATIARHTADVKVVDDDPTPTVTAADVTATEGDTSLTDVAVVVKLSAASGHDVVVDYATSDGSATAAGGDFVPAHGSVVIPAGATSGTVHLTVVGDTVMERGESFSIHLTAADHASIGDSEAVVSIVDNEPLLVTVTSPTVTEGNAGTTDAPFTVSVTAPPPGETVTVPWALGGGTADLGADVAAGSGTLLLDATTPSATVVASVVADTVVEDLTTETFRLVVAGTTTSAGRRVIVADAPLAMIVDDDHTTPPPPPALTAAAGPDVTGSEGSPVAITGTVGGADPATVTVAWSVDDARCVIANPGVLATSVTCPDEAAATLTLTVSDAAGAAASDTAALVIGNVAPTVTITAPSAGTTVSTGTAVAVTATITDRGTTDVVTCSVTWGDGTAPTACTATHAFSAAGTVTVTVTADDGDGGTGTASVGLVVTAPAPPPPPPAWKFDGFYSPVKNPPAVNVVKAGSTVPLKFSLGGDHGLGIFAPGYPATVAHARGGKPAGAPLQTVTPGSATLTYDPATGRYQYNWKTPKSWAGTCRRLVIRFADGTEVYAEFRFT